MFWFDELAQIEKRAFDKTGKFAPGKDTHETCQARALELYDKACTAFKTKQSSKRDANINVLQGLLKKGTTEDQISALAVSVQESPVHLGEFCISKLIAVAGKKSRDHAWAALGALRDIYTGCLLPDGRKLRHLDAESWNEIKPRLSPEECNQWMVYRYFESRIKSLYSDFITVLESASTDPVEWFRMKTLALPQELLSLKPEAEVRLLVLLVNKVGDPARKVSAQALRLIRHLLEAHANMKGVIVDEIQRFLMRANITPRAQYQAVILLTQIVFAPHDGPLARRLVDIYLSLFSRKDLESESDSRLLSALLTGLNRAFPFAASLMNDEQYDAQTTRLLRLARSKNFNAAVQSLMLLQQVMSARQSLCTRYYTALYDSLSLPSLVNSSKHSLYLNLLYRTIKNDVSVPRIAAFVKRLLQVCLQSRPGFVCGSLILLAELCKHHPAIRCMIDQAVNKEDDVKYDPAKRDPLFANANATCLWELHILEQHYHPSVSKFSSQILNNVPIVYNGNPIADFTLRHFLDRFVYRNPKKTEATRSALAPQPSAIDKMAPVNTEEFWKLDESQVREDEKFMHKYFRNRLERGEISEKPVNDDENSDEEKDAFADQLFENELRKTDGAIDIDDDDDDLLNGEHISDDELNEAFGDEDDDDCIEGDEMDSENEDIDDEHIADDDDVIFHEQDDDAFDDDGFGDDLIEEDTSKSKKNKKKTSQSAFADADDYAELLELTNGAAKANNKTESWQAGSKKRQFQSPRNKPNGKQSKKQKGKPTAKSRK